MISAIIILVLLGLMDLMLFVACFELEKDEEVRRKMSWWSDGEPFDEWEGCDRCNFNKKPSAKTCKDCKSGDKWNRANWDEEGADDDS